MLITPHFLTGIAITKGIPEAAPAAIAAIGSHFVLDAIPHWDYIGEAKPTLANIILTVADGLIALGLWWWLIPPELRWYGFLIGAFAALPDFVIAPKYLWPGWVKLPGLKQFDHWHGQQLQHNRELNVRKDSLADIGWGLLPQLILVGWLIWYLVK